MFLKTELWVYSSPILVTIDSLNEQGDALGLHFESVIAAVELPVARGKLKNKIKTFLANPLCRGVDELCTKQAGDFAIVAVDLERTISEGTELYRKAGYVTDECLVLCKENRALLAENEGLEDLVELAVATNDRNNGVVRQYQSALMHYNELQSRSAGVEAIHMKFEQNVAAGEVAKAGFRQKPGPKQGSTQKREPKNSRRGKTNHSEWNAQENSASKSLNPMAPPWSRKKDKNDNLSTAMEL
jgi:hypothetical protein